MTTLKPAPTATLAHAPTHTQLTWLDHKRNDHTMLNSCSLQTRLQVPALHSSVRARRVGTNSVSPTLTSEASLTAPAGNFVAGFLAANIVDGLLYPLDSMKTRQQSLAAAKTVARRAPRATQPWPGRKTAVIARTLPPAAPSLYAGMVANGFGSGLGCGVFFISYESSKEMLELHASHLPSPVRHMLAASVGAVGCSVTRVPFEIVKQRMQVGLATTIPGAVRDIYAKYGLRGFTLGLGALCMREIPFDAVEFAMYEHLKQHWSVKLGIRPEDVQRGGSLKGSAIVGAVFGSVAGAVAAATTLPFDVAKTVVMTQTAPPGSKHFHASGIACMKHIWRTQGYKAFTRGLVPRVAWRSIGGGTFFSVLESCKHLLRNKDST